MQKKLVIALTILLSAIAIIWFFGLFPVMRVNGDYTLYRIYGERAGALERFESKSRLASGNSVLSDSEKSEIKKVILQHVIMEQIVQQYIDEHTALAEIKNTANAVVANTLKEADPDVLPRATKEVYGWSVDEFVQNVLYPQALQNELQKVIESDGASFEEFTRMQLNNAQIKLYVVPWKWENGGLVEK